MSLGYMAGFDTAALTLDSGGFVTTGAGGLRGGNALIYTQTAPSYTYEVDGVGSGDTIIMGFQFKGGSGGVWSPSGCVIAAGLNQLTPFEFDPSLVLGSGGDLEVWKDFGRAGRTLLGTATGALASPNNWYHIQFKFKMSTTVGVVEVKVDNTVVLTLTGLDLLHSTLPSLILGPILINGTDSPVACTMYYDDFWAVDLTGTYNNDYLGIAIVDRLDPTGLGVVESTDSAAIDDPTPDGAATSIFFPPGNGDRWAMTDLTAGYAPAAVQADWNAVGVHFGHPGLLETQFDTNSTVWTAPSNLSFPYGSYSQQNLLVELNPVTSVLWTTAEINAVQAGLLSTGSGAINGVNVTQFVLEVLAIPAVTTTRPYFGTVIG